MEPTTIENGNAAVESGPESTTIPKKEDEITKRSIRVQCWKKILEGKFATEEQYIFNRVTDFVGADQAAKLLSETEEFKNAKKIKVNLDRSQVPIKAILLETKSEVYVAPPRKSEAILSRIELPPDADEATLKAAASPNSSTQFGKEIPFDEDVKLDMLIIGAVAVDREGRHIGRGHGYVDLDYALLAHLGMVTKDTLIVTTVHDVQVHDKLPADLFQSYDITVDMIVTPTEVIRVAKRLPRPTGIEWHLLSERRLGIVPVLKVLKEHDEKASGKPIVLKAEDTDVEANRKSRYTKNKVLRRRRRLSRRTSKKENGDAKEGAADDSGAMVNRRPQRRRIKKLEGSKENRDANENNESSDNAAGDHSNQQQPGRMRRNRMRGPRRGEGGGGGRGGGGGDGDLAAGEGSQGAGGPRKFSNRARPNGGGGGRDEVRGQRGEGRRWNRDNMQRICVKLTNVSRESRARDIKQSLRDRQCNPNRIVMKGDVCFAHYFKPLNEAEAAETEIVQALANLTIKSESGATEEYPVNVELVKQQPPQAAAAAATDETTPRIETADVTAV